MIAVNQAAVNPDAAASRDAAVRVKVTTALV